MSAPPGPITAEDVDDVVDTAVTALSERLDRDWHVPTRASDWTCWETVEHISDSLFFYASQLVPVRESLAGGYPYAYRAARPGGPEGIMFAHPGEGRTGLLRVLTACGGVLVSLVRTAPPTLRAHHMWGRSDPQGFAAMGVVEVLAHVHDIAGALDLSWAPPEDLCDRALTRLFPGAPPDTDRWSTLLWATGRGDLPGHPRLDDWRWHSEPR